MSIFEYDQEAHMRLVREEGREEGKEEANVELILNMYGKGYTLEQIADVTEKEIGEIQAIIEEKRLVLA